MGNSSQFQPNWVSAPGDTIQDLLEERNISLLSFAAQLDQTLEDVEKLLRGDRAITIDRARILERLFGAPSTFWISREAKYREELVRLQSPVKQPDEAGWLNSLPLNEMIKLGWIEAAGKSVIQAVCLAFFGVPDVETWKKRYNSVGALATFRTSPTYASELGAVAAWIRYGELESASVACNPWNSDKFMETLSGIRGLTRKRDPKVFLPILKSLCALCGVSVVIARAPSGCRASGATRFISEDKALLLLSFRYLSDDHFWFTFFHEAAHLLLHNKGKVFLEGVEMSSTDEEEEANTFAANILVPPEFHAAMLRLPIEGREVIRFGRAIGISPGIIVGQLQHCGQLKRSQLNGLKTRFQWRSS